MTEEIKTDYFTTEELAKYLGLSVSTLNSWRVRSNPKNSISIPYKKFGKAVRYKKSDVYEYERRQTRGND